MKFISKKILAIVLATLVAISSLSIVAYADNTAASGDSSVSTTEEGAQAGEQGTAAEEGAQAGEQETAAEEGAQAGEQENTEGEGNKGATPKNNNGGGAGGWLVIGGYILFFVVIGYFLIYRPNKKRKKQEEELRNSITLGDEITTIGGIVGRVVNIKDDNVTIESSIDKTLMEFKNWAIREIKKPITDDEPESK